MRFAAIASLATAASALLASLWSGEARAGATLMTGLGGPNGYGTSCMPPNDDGSWPEIDAITPDPTGLDITPAFPKGLHFYTGNYTHAWINNNGNISFNAALSTFTPNAFPGAPQPMIAPYWADVDTRDATYCGNAGYPDAEGYPAGAMCMNPQTNGVWWSLTPGQMVVTWDSVGYYQCHPTPVMSFQMILTAAGCGDVVAPDGGVAGVDFDIEFRYATCGWEVGDASGGTDGFCPAGSVPPACNPAQAGFDSGENPDKDYWSLPMSLTSGVSTELCTQSNLTPAQPGVWRFSVRGGMVQCPTAGQACNTGQPGICAAGLIQCNLQGMTTCVPINKPQPPQCNGLDNNCDGVIDDGPCPATDICWGAQCQPKCQEGDCPTGKVCNTVCMDPNCVGVTCPQGQWCTNGTCVDACSDVKCPIGQVCRLGTCVDPCNGVTCPMGQVCDNGACVPACSCAMCPTGQTCEMSGKCIASDCASVTCGAGQVCQGGVCIDACTGAMCPMDQICKMGSCVQAPPAPIDAGMGIVAPDGGGSSSGGSVDASVEGGGAQGDGGNGEQFAGNAGKSSGCGCSVVTGGEGWAGLGLGVAIGAVLRRRRRARRLS